MGPKEQLYMTAEKSIHISDAKLNGKRSIYYRIYMQACRKWGGRGGHVPPPHFLADQLTLFQPGGAHYPHPVLRAPPLRFSDIATALFNGWVI